MAKTKTAPTRLEELLEAAEAEAAELERRQAVQAENLERESLRSDRQAAVTHVRKILDLETDRDAWARLATDGDVVDRAVVMPLDDEISLGFRQRGHVAGGPVLVAMAPDRDGSLVGSSVEIGRLSDLPAAVLDARARAAEWNEILERAEAQHDGDVAAAIEETDKTRPTYRLEADTPAELLAAAIELVIESR